MSNRIFQGLVHQMRDAVGRTLGVIDETGTIIACSELSKIGEVFASAVDTFSDSEIHIINGYTFCAFGSHAKTDYAVFIEGTDEIAGRFAGVCCVSLENIE
ncbi:MAG: PucR family transcriptional regulator, partial [Ruminococcus sp.]|nr:PucR family transcriptional regulator [Ruminococcus sp.]